MKKIVLSLLFVFATGTSFMNANSTTNNNADFFDCFDATDKAARDLGRCMNITYEQEHVYFGLIYDACMEGLN